MNRLQLVCLFMLTVSAACSRVDPTIKGRWSSRSSAPLTSESHPQLFHLTGQIADQKWSLAPGLYGQRWNNRYRGFEIENQYVQGVFAAGGKAKYLAYELSPQFDSSWDRPLDRLQNQPPPRANRDVQAEIVIAQLERRWVPAWRLTRVNETEQVIEYQYYDENRRLLSRRLQSVAELDGTARVFNTRPDQGQLLERRLTSLIGDGTLTSYLVKALSASASSAFAPDHLFIFPPESQQFDQVQAYYFANQHLEWFQKTLSVTLPRRLEIKLHLGAPETTNAMFYYGMQVRLGDGDGQLYRQIPRDPSIVKHEVSHAFVEHLSGMGFEGDPGVFSEAFSDIFTVLAEEKPELAAFAYVPGPYRRTVAQLVMAKNNPKLGKYEKSLMISSLFWRFSEQSDATTAARLAVQTLVRLGPRPTWEDFVPALTDAAADTLSATENRQLRLLLAEANWIEGIENQ